jgi:hypothetical protein
MAEGGDSKAGPSGLDHFEQTRSTETADDDRNNDPRGSGIKVWLADLSQRAFLLTVISGVTSGAIVWFVQSYISDREQRSAALELVNAIRVSTASECNRLKETFAKLYDGYPVGACDINVYRLPQPDVALVEYLNDRRETIVATMGEDGAKLIRSGALSAKAYDRIFTAKYFQSSIDRWTVTFSDYFDPLTDMCAIVDVKLTVPDCQ